ncbi:hypothetical protein [Roseomonas sp. CECT 9278]|uniref:hypothetical protein n=1 Tax=Roseomonas sp. CECT 9278 TaxID=2845823 RepID=UPI001E48C292|nr:hypothetical protein [Roseomonas sp. CECT 9278]CAH0127159.1 hypothetical protein ROS9278_00122 [Roseomonas sp. CECT 9278]
MEAEYFEIEVDHLATGIREQLDLAEDMSSSPAVALRASVRALLRSFTGEQIAAALKQETR